MDNVLKTITWKSAVIDASDVSDYLHVHDGREA
jgi:hypothetical protein